MDLKELAEGLYLEEYIEGQKKELRNRELNEELILSYKAVMNTPDGKRVLWDILEMCGVFQLSMTGNSMTYFKEGKRSIGLYLMTMLNLGNRFEDVLGFQKLAPEKDNG